MGTLKFPFDQTIEPATNDARMEFMYEVVDGLPPARQKRLIVRAAMEEVNFITPLSARIMLESLNLRDA